MSDQNGGSEEPEREEPIIRDKRKIDPETGKVRQPGGEQKDDDGEHDLSHEELVDVGPAEQKEEGDILSDDDLDILSGQTTAEKLAAERLADLQRVTAEYA